MRRSQAFQVGRAQPVQAIVPEPAGCPQARRRPTPAPASQAALTPAMLRPIVQEAKSRWDAAGLDAAQAARLRRLDVKVADLPPGHLGLALAGAIYVDRDAAGYGWFVDATPGDDREFPASPGGPAWSHADLL